MALPSVDVRSTSTTPHGLGLCRTARSSSSMGKPKNSGDRAINTLPHEEAKRRMSSGHRKPKTSRRSACTRLPGSKAYCGSTLPVRGRLLVVLLFGCIAWASPAGAFSCDRAESQLAAAAKEFRKGRLDAAELILGEIQERYPGCTSVLLGRGRLARARGNIEQAKDLLEQYKKAQPTDPKGYAELGEIFISRQDYRRAETMSELALLFGPEDPDALLLQATILTLKGNPETASGRQLWSTAEKSLKKASALDPDNTEIHFKLGRHYDRLRQSAEAVAEFEKVVRMDPGRAAAYDYLALNLEPIGEIERAEKAYIAGLELNNGPAADPFLDYNYGRFLMKQGRLADAEVHLNRAVQSLPDMRAAYYERGKLLTRMKRFTEARADQERALQLPDTGKLALDLQVYYQLSIVYGQLGNAALARKYADLSRRSVIEVPR